MLKTGMSRKLTPKVSVQRSRKISLPYHFQSWVLLHAHEKRKEKKTGTTKCPQLYYFMEPLFFLVLAISLLFTYLAFFLMAIARGEEEV